MKRLLLILLFIPSVLWAQDVSLPALYDVSNVAADDVLNVRTSPHTNAQIMDTLGPDRIGVEVLAFNDDRSWGMVHAGEYTGWVSMAYMTRQPDQHGSNKLPVPMWCSGTEPFWFLEITGDNVVLDDPGMDSGAITMEREPVPDLLHSPRGVLVAGDMTGFVSREACSDGMSDRLYGWRIDFIRSGNGGAIPFSGCCSLQP